MAKDFKNLSLTFWMCGVVARLSDQLNCFENAGEICEIFFTVQHLANEMASLTSSTSRGNQWIILIFSLQIVPIKKKVTDLSELGLTPEKPR